MTATDKYLNNLYIYMINKYGVDAASRNIQDLEWYVNTGRASTVFLKKLFEAKIFVVARILHRGGSTEDVIKRLKAKLQV